MERGKREVTAVVLGNMQDGGLPHIGCRCPRCRAAFEEPGRGSSAACLAILDEREGEETAVWLIDATPDIKWQLDRLAPWLGAHPKRPNRLRQPDGIFLTHAHLGHIGGLPQLGREAMAVQRLPVYATPRLVSLLRQNRLWSPLVARLRLIPLAINEALELSPGLRITPLPVPHRDEWDVGTLAFHIQGPARSLLYLPDIDTWDLWPEAEATLGAVDYALVDGSFFSRDEIGGRVPVAHPLVTDTIGRFAHLPCRLVLTHINHSNPILDEGSAAQTAVLESGVQIAEQGQRFRLGG